VIPARYSLSLLQELLGTVDVWICNAGYSGSFKPFLSSDPSAIEAVVKTNLLGTLLCAREAGRLMLQQKLGGHIFMMDGAGADGSATPQYAAYGELSAQSRPLVLAMPQPCSLVFSLFLQYASSSATLLTAV
jgi:NAD(P)-dependent dehydrogenase (short-subunit alcohol dehydrogenase family)